MESSEDELATLIARCAIRDQQALQQLYKRTSAFLNGVAYRIIRNDELSNEILQEAFVQIWQNAGSYRQHLSKPLTWMTSIVRYRALDRLKVEQRHRNRPVDAEEEQQSLERHSDGRGPQDDVEQAQQHATLYECLEQLNDKVKISVELAYLYGYSREELAEKLDTKVNTVKSWLRRGSERLKKCLETKIAAAS